MIDALHRRTRALPVCTGIGGSSHVTMKLRLVHAPPTYSRMLWRTSPRRSRRLPPAGFILPCQPLLVDRPPAGSDWLHEIKHDGYRIIACKDGSRVTLWTRYGTNFTDRLPKIAEAVCSLAAESALIDGEAVAVRPDGHSDFAALRTKVGSARACFVAFDLLNLNGEDFRQQPIEERRAALSPLVAGVHCILFSDALVAEGALVFAKACELGLEGIVSKRAGSRYSSGNSRQWLKSKNPEFERT
jgi:bifunctional non-homologous end joining protein LigD